MCKPRDDRQKHLLRLPLELISALGHPLARLTREIDWDFLHTRFRSVYGPVRVSRRCRAGWWPGF